MASRKKSENVVRCFDVSSPRLHEGGYTVYKVTQKIIQVECPESDVTEIRVWRRFNDFKKLYKSMSKLHSALHRHRKETFPPFVKSQIFGRFDNSVLLERQQCAQDLLNFIGQRSYLIKSKHFKEFFEGGEETDCVDVTSDPILQPIRLSTSSFDDIESECDMSSVTDQGAVSDSAEPGQGSSTLMGDTKGPEGKHGVSTVEGAQGPSSGAQHSGTLKHVPSDLGGVWQYRQTEEVLSSDDEGEEGSVTPKGGDEDDLNASAAEIDISMFDPLSSSRKEHERWLKSALTECGDGDTTAKNPAILTPPTIRQSPVSQSEESGSKIKATSSDSSLNKLGLKSQGDDVSIKSSSSTSSLLNLANYPIPSSTNLLSPDSASEIPIPQSQPRGNQHNGRRVEYGRGDSNFTLLSGKLSQPGLSTSPVLTPQSTSPASSPRSSVRSTAKSSPPTSQQAAKVAAQRSKNKQQSIISLDLQNRGSYIINAAKQISLAQQCEANANYTMAFTYYKAGVNVLIAGVQGDDHKARQDMVRRKTGKYLQRAEDIYQKFVISSNGQQDTKRWHPGDISPLAELDPDIAFLQGQTSELDKYRVLGVIDRVMLVMDTQTDSTYVIKVLHKSCSSNANKANIVPMHVPFMIKLHRFFETDSGIYLLLDHASGGKLKTYVSSYLHNQQFPTDMDAPAPGTNIYTGHSLIHPVSSKTAPLDAIPQVVLPTTFSHKDCTEAVGADSCSIEDSCTPGFAKLFSGDVSPDCSSEQNVDKSNSALPEPESDGVIQDKPHGDFTDILRSSQQKSVEHFSITSYDSDSGAGCSRSDRGLDIVSDEVQNSQEVSHCCDSGVHEQKSASPLPPNDRLQPTVPTSQPDMPSSQTSGGGRPVDFPELLTSDPTAPVKHPPAVQPPSKDAQNDKPLLSVFPELMEELSADALHLPESVVKQWAAQLVLVVEQLHELGIVIQDLHPDNVLLGSEGRILVSYISQWVCVDRVLSQTALDNLYVAPEVSRLCDITPVCDWWSVGVFLYELFTGKSLVSLYPCGLTSHTELILPDYLTAEAKALLNELLRINPAERLCSGVNGDDEVIRHPFFSDISWESLASNTA